MKKLIPLLLALFIVTIGTSQNPNPKANLKFETIYYDAIYKWVAFPKNETDSTYVYGFIYLDMQAGLTFNHEGTFHIDQNDKLIRSKKEPNAMIKARLGNNTKNVALLSTIQIKELGEPVTPEWLKIYKKPIDDVESLTRTGYHLNAVGGSKKALEYLLKAYKKSPHHKGLEFELGFAYNAIGQYEKAITVLNLATTKDPKNALLYKEFGYAYLNLHKLPEAEAIYKRGVEISTDKELSCEMAINMANYYFIQKSKTKFDEWAALIKQNAVPNSQYVKYIEYFEKEWDSKQ